MAAKALREVASGVAVLAVVLDDSSVEAWGRTGRFHFLEIFGLYKSFVEHGSQYPERDQSLLLACSFYTRRISASIAC
jgi:hypothetical protein